MQSVYCVECLLCGLLSGKKLTEQQQQPTGWGGNAVGRSQGLQTDTVS